MVDKREVERLQKDAEAAGRESWWKAFLLDTNPEGTSAACSLSLSLSLSLV
jgi:translation elongation factor EF-1alpha